MMSCATKKEYAIQWKDIKTNEVKQSRPLSDSLKTVKHVDWLNNRHPYMYYVVVKLNKN